MASTRCHLALFALIVSIQDTHGAVLRETQRLDNPHQARFDRFSYSLAMDGNWAILGAPEDDEFGNNKGAVHFFHFANGMWSPRVKRTSSLGSSNIYLGGHEIQPTPRTGKGIAIAGEWAFAGAYEYDEGVTNSGAAFVFRFDGSTWTETQAILPSSVAAAFGFSVPAQFQFGSCIVTDGNTAVIAAPGNYLSSQTQGKAFVFRRSGLTWTPLDVLTPQNAQIDDTFGWAMDLQDDTLVIGAHGYANNTGQVSVFVRQADGHWRLQATLSDSSPEDNDNFGFSVAIDGDWIAVGVPEEDPSPPIGIVRVGAVRLFRRSGGVWPATPAGTLFPSVSTPAEHFGKSVSMDSGLLIVGAPEDDDVSSSGTIVDGNGSAWAYQLDTASGTWKELHSLRNTDGAQQFAGYMAMAADLRVYDGRARVLLSGVSHQTLGLTESGQAYSYLFGVPAGPTPTPAPPTSTPTFSPAPTLSPTPSPTCDASAVRIVSLPCSRVYDQRDIAIIRVYDPRGVQPSALSVTIATTPVTFQPCASVSAADVNFCFCPCGFFPGENVDLRAEYTTACGTASQTCKIHFVNPNPTPGPTTSPTPTVNPNTVTPVPTVPTPTLVDTPVPDVLFLRAEYAPLGRHVTLDLRVVTGPNDTPLVTLYAGLDLFGTFYFLPDFTEYAVALAGPFSLQAGLDSGWIRLLDVFPLEPVGSPTELHWYAGLIDGNGELYGNLASTVVTIP